MGNLLPTFLKSLMDNNAGMDNNTGNALEPSLTIVKEQLNKYINEIEKEVKDRDNLIERLIEENEKLGKKINHSDASQMEVDDKK
ncbi:hypothetical protein AC249_AIPGENE3510 [Exaiptasia diaphana]|nr:hypothetical protein AC249_AIPGENE3510 [Exaiptasia diaphana]